MYNYLESNQLEWDLEILEKQLHRLTQEVRAATSEMEKMIKLIQAAKASKASQSQ